MSLAYELLWFLPWCWFVNMSFDLLVHAGRFVPWIARHNVPIDARIRLYDGNRLLGDSTTWLGLLQAVVLGAIGEAIAAGHYFFLYAVLVWTGHMLGSFTKRRLSMERGRFLPGVDHGNYILLAGGVAVWIGTLSFASLVVGLAMTYALTPLVTAVAHRAGIRSRPI